MRNLSVIKGLYQGNGVTRRWAIPFEYNDTAQIFVTLTTYDEGDYTYRVLDSTEYTIDEDSVEIVYPKTVDGEPIPSTQYLTVWRDTDLLQLMDLTNQGAAWPDSIEASLDKLHQIVQELAEGLSRSLKVDIGDPQTPDEKLVAIQDYVLAAAESSRSASASEASAQRAAEAAATSESNAAESERLASGYADTASDAASRAEDSAISARAYNAPDYDNETTYQAGDVVTFTDGNSYRALQETTGNEPPNIIYWQKVTDYVGDDFFEVDEYGYIVPMDSPSHSRYWRVDQNGYIVPIEGGDGGYRPDTRSLSAEYLNVTNEGYVKHLRADDVNAGNLSAAGNVTAGMVTTPQANITTLTANAVNAGNVTKVLNTVNDMLSDNLSVGMTARTLGYYAVDDGCGETYSIINSSEIPVDGDKIIQLNNGLYAKRITQSDLPDFFLGSFFSSQNDQSVRLYTSLDGINFSDFKKYDNIIRDTSIQYYKNNFYLVVYGDNNTTFRIYKSKNLKDWSFTDYNVFQKTQAGGQYIWAPDLFIDDDGSAYVYFAYPWGKERVGTATSDNYALDVFVSYCDDIENGNFGNSILVELPVSNDDATVVRSNYIDANVTKIDNYYYMIVKNEHQPSLQQDGSYLGLNLQLMKSDNPINNWQLVTTFPLKYNVGIEGCVLLRFKDMIYIYAESYADISLPDINSEFSGVWCWKAKVDNIETGPYQLECLQAAHSIRHGTVIAITDNYAKRVIKNGSVNFLNTNTTEVTYRYLPLYIGAEPDAQGITPYKITNFAPVQNAIYKVTKGYTIINVNNINNAHDFYILMEENPILYKTRVCIKGNRDIWIGSSASRNGQLLHFRLTGVESSGNLKGDKVRYVGDILTLIGNMGYSQSGKHVLLAKFNLGEYDDLQTKMRIVANSYGGSPMYEATYYIKIGHDNGGVSATTVAQWSLMDLSYSASELGAKLFKISNTEYQLWGYSVSHRLGVSVIDYIQKDFSSPFSSILSFPPQVADAYPSATEVPIST